MKSRVYILFVALLILTALPGAHSQVKQADSAESLSEPQTLQWVRTVNTMELEIFVKSKTYAPLEDLLKHPRFPSAEIVPVATDPTTGTLKNYNLRVVVSPDGQHYSLALKPATARECQVALFSDESGVIYPASALGCPEPDRQKLGQ